MVAEGWSGGTKVVGEGGRKDGEHVRRWQVGGEVEMMLLMAMDVTILSYVLEVGRKKAGEVLKRQCGGLIAGI